MAETAAAGQKAAAPACSPPMEFNIHAAPPVRIVKLPKDIAKRLRGQADGSVVGSYRPVYADDPPAAAVGGGGGGQRGGGSGAPSGIQLQINQAAADSSNSMTQVSLQSVSKPTAALIISRAYPLEVNDDYVHPVTVIFAAATPTTVIIAAATPTTVNVAAATPATVNVAAAIVCFTLVSSCFNALLPPVLLLGSLIRLMMCPRRVCCCCICCCCVCCCRVCCCCCVRCCYVCCCCCVCCCCIRCLSSHVSLSVCRRRHPHPSVREGGGQRVGEGRLRGPMRTSR
eukprot:GHVU01209838.1.p1 GENE.GHVU01209838.1~~GHVU01209838.1.p1  ORF type:complete len:285 (+),score=39.91 GHVU01209838.1:388-1242(+)